MPPITAAGKRKRIVNTFGDITAPRLERVFDYVLKKTWLNIILFYL